MSTIQDNINTKLTNEIKLMVQVVNLQVQEYQCISPGVVNGSKELGHMVCGTEDKFIKEQYEYVTKLIAKWS